MTRYIVIHDLDDFRSGTRVEAHPVTDLFMRGARYGTVVKVGTKMVHVKFDKLKLPVAVRPANLLVVER